MVPLISQIDRVLNSTTGTVRILRDLAPRSIPPVQDGASQPGHGATKLLEDCALVTERRVKNSQLSGPRSFCTASMLLKTLSFQLERPLC